MCRRQCRPPAGERKGLTKKEIAADHPTWCPGCGDFSVLALYFKLIEKRKIWHEKITTVAGIGCSSRFPYFVQAHGAHYHPRTRAAVCERHFPFAARPPRLRFRRRRRRLFHRRKSFQPHGAQEHQDDLLRDGQLGLWPDEKADLAHVAARLQEQDRPMGLGGLSDQPDEAGDRRRGHVCRAHDAHESRTTFCR